MIAANNCGLKRRPTHPSETRTPDLEVNSLAPQPAELQKVAGRAREGHAARRQTHAQAEAADRRTGQDTQADRRPRTNFRAAGEPLHPKGLGANRGEAPKTQPPQKNTKESKNKKYNPT